MTRTHHEDVRISGMGLMPRFAITMTLSLAVVMAIAGYALYDSSTRIARSVQDETLKGATVLTLRSPAFEQVGNTLQYDSRTRVESAPIRYGDDLEQRGFVYQIRKSREDLEPEMRILVPGTIRRSEEGLLGLIVAATLLVILVGAGMAMWVARQVAGPIASIVDEVRQISHGDLRSLSGVEGAREIKILARAIDRMTKDLETAQEAELELSIREREMELATGVREALLPVTTPLVKGYDIGSSHLSSPRFGGDFHDYIELPDGRVGMLVCDVAGQGVPAALVGATARSYLRSTLLQGGDLHESLCRINRELARDVRRGMFVTALYALLEPGSARVRVACAGHKIPLLLYRAADQKLRLLHPEGIALAFDNGPVFERALQIEELPLEPGDRLVLTNSGPVKVRSEAGDELGEKPFYRHVLQFAALDTQRFLKSVRRTLVSFAGEAAFPSDISLVTVSRAG